MLNQNRVVVAMSGGVDSSLAAAILKEKGYEVIGITMKIWPSEETPVDNENSCCSLSAVEDARSVAYKLDIPFYVVNFEDLFKRTVIKNFKEEYSQARTPNPCVVCNKVIKFSAFLNKAKELGAYYMATGHYAKIIQNDTGRYLLKRAADLDKDQTYMLYNLTQEQLEHTMFPLSDHTKSKTRDLAKDYNLRVHDKPESQEICFIPDDNYRRFLKENYPEIIESGPILDLEGNKLGKHRGLPFYTIGQRRGLGLESNKKWYVVDMDSDRNALIVGDNEDVFKEELIVEKINWISIEKLTESKKVQAKIRYNSPSAEATLYPVDKNTVKVVFEEPQRAITPGQSAVFYNEDIVVGGGVIKE
ncbi:tRNA 2-thiouridine(34) synthase MnmA [Sporohalobacter salinus]|uniref:tRNA 2-thiouridine(34) synthase MnmA n=1 Tax=Sporohalobacter salinus TaxID=1494606 RepID=UPI00195FE000|nr:tRNA 2-thiouridine(34) synthase MnmA [Sporohalobacter salinus]MBM7624712.1 tRNA-specific 2-thiouridylase [Sporohalobacter salinus]